MFRRLRGAAQAGDSFVVPHPTKGGVLARHCTAPTFP